MWFQHLAWNHVCMISYLHCLVFKEHCFLTGFVKSLSDFCKFSVWVSFYIIPHQVPFVKNFLKYFLSLLSKQPRQAFSSKALLCCISATTMYILQQICTSVNTFYFIYIFFRNTACGHNDFCSVRLNGPDAKVSCHSGCCRIIVIFRF